jgi:hypothetical protein
MAMRPAAPAIPAKTVGMNHQGGFFRLPSMTALLVDWPVEAMLARTTLCVARVRSIRRRTNRSSGRASILPASFEKAEA